MLSALESRAALGLVTSAAVSAANRLASAPRDEVLETAPVLIGYFSDGSAALAADFYDDQRERASAKGRFLAEPVVTDRAEKIRRATIWASEPSADITGRLAEVVQLETARPFRDTVLTNQQRDPSSIGWRRISIGGCAFCRMLSDRGAIYKSTTARFASHAHCGCTSQPVFEGQGGEEASTLQYVASQRRRSESDQKRLREYLTTNYGSA